MKKRAKESQGEPKREEKWNSRGQHKNVSSDNYKIRKIIVIVFLHIPLPVVNSLYGQSILHDENVAQPLNLKGSARLFNSFLLKSWKLNSLVLL